MNYREIKCEISYRPAKLYKVIYRKGVSPPGQGTNCIGGYKLVDFKVNSRTQVDIIIDTPDSQKA